ncbi:MAG: SDR family NAD(P)-dependent oxidoreductase, partial [Anaerolineae bacterium]
MHDMNQFENKVAIVTGGASGIGRGLCEELAQRGAAMVVVAD